MQHHVNVKSRNLDFKSRLASEHVFICQSLEVNIECLDATNKEIQHNIHVDQLS